MNSVEKLIVKNKKGKFEINEYKKTLQFETPEEAVQFLIDAIRFWKDKFPLFFNDNHTRWRKQKSRNRLKWVELPENKWKFDYQYKKGCYCNCSECYYSYCKRCDRSNKVLHKIFGDTKNFNNLPFVTFHNYSGGYYCYYCFSLNLLKYFVKHGHKKTSQLVEKIKERKKKKKAEKRAKEEAAYKQKKLDELNEMLNGEPIDPNLQKQILEYVGYGLHFVNSEVAVVVTSRTISGNTGGNGYYDQVRVFYKNKELMREWQWRDRFEARKDKHWLRVLDIGEVNITKEDNTLKVKVERINDQKYHNRSTIFTFET
jgi:hypothetical protein